MGILSDAWDIATMAWDEADSWLYSVINRKRRVVLEDEGGVSTFYAPPGVTAEEWQKLIRDKIGGDVQEPRNILAMHSACLLTYMSLEGSMPAGRVLEAVKSKEIVVQDILPDFMLRMHGIALPEATVEEVGPELPKP